MSHLASKAIVVFSLAIGTQLNPCSSFAASEKDLSGKAVLANVDKFPFAFRAGKIQKQIAPGKASILSPKTFPISLEIWTGNQAIQWEKVSLEGPGVFVARFAAGRWTLKKKDLKAKEAAKQAAVPSKTTRPSVGQVGSPRRVVQRGGGKRVVVNPPRFRRPWVGRVWSPIGRSIWAAASIYRFIRDEEDRELFRRLIDGEIDDEIRREIEDRIWDHIKDDAVNLPSDELDELERAWDDFRDISGDDWKEAVNLPADEWDRIRDEFGDTITDSEWDGLQEDFDQIGDTFDLNQEDIGTFDEVGLDDLEQNVDLGDLVGNEIGDGMVDFGNDIDTSDLGDFTMEAEDLNIGDLAEPLGGDWDLGGMGGGALNPLGDLAPDAGQGFGGDVGGDILGGVVGGMEPGNVDGGGWDSYDYGNYDWGGGNDWGGGDFGGGDFGGGDWGGGDWGGGGWGGDFGGGDFGGGDWGGDFGGGDWGGGGDFGGDFGGFDF